MVIHKAFDYSTGTAIARMSDGEKRLVGSNIYLDGVGTFTCTADCCSSADTRKTRNGCVWGYARVCACDAALLGTNPNNAPPQSHTLREHKLSHCAPGDGTTAMAIQTYKQRQQTIVIVE